MRPGRTRDSDACNGPASSGIVDYMDLDRPSTRPAVLTIDDDPDVLKAIERDLRRRYAKSYRILSANSGKAALDLLDRLQERGEPVALLLADHGCPK